MKLFVLVQVETQDQDMVSFHNYPILCLSWEATGISHSNMFPMRFTFKLTVFIALPSFHD